jgi:hypothetical protein
LLTLLAGNGLHAQERPALERRFAVEHGSTLKLDTFAGAIKVTPVADSDEIVVRVRLEATGGKTGAADRWMDGVAISTDQRDGIVSVVVRHRGGSVSVDLGEKPTGIVRFDISVPASTHLDLTTRSGSVEVGHDLEGDVHARAIFGSMFFGRMLGKVDAQVDDGDLTVSRASGTVSLKTLRGDIDVGTLISSATLETASGNISIFSAERAINAKASAGDISATLSAALSEDSVLATSGGDIRVAVSPASNLFIRARSVWGKITTRLPIQTTTGGTGQRKLEGSINQGGSQLNLSASGGNITMTASDSADS